MQKLFYIDYPQEHIEGRQHTYCCAYCKIVTTTINGRLEGHQPTCTYRLQQEKAGYECNNTAKEKESVGADEFD